MPFSLSNAPKSPETILYSKSIVFHTYYHKDKKDFAKLTSRKIMLPNSQYCQPLINQNQHVDSRRQFEPKTNVDQLMINPTDKYVSRTISCPMKQTTFW